MKPWKRIEPTTVTKVGYRTIITKTFELPDGAVETFDTFHSEGQEFASVIAVTAAKKVVIARQFRPGPEKIMDELPAGFVDPGETPEAAVRRELLEETGYRAGSIEYLGYTSKDAYMNGKWHGFIAYDCEQMNDNSGAAHEHEYVERALISIEELIDIAKTDRMTDPAIVFMAYDKLMELRDAESH